VEGIKDAQAARAQGYAPALVIGEHPSEKAYKLAGSEITFIPCHAQTKPGGKEVSCVNCRLCMKADWLFSTNRGIAFSVHGVNKNSLKKHLTVIQ
jgi:hypothetical protein